MSTADSMINTELLVYFDGLCPLCSREINHYRKQEGSNKISFIDITDENFSAAEQGLDPVKVHQVMHVKTSNGDLRTGVDAFVAIWQVLPKFSWLAKLAQNRLVRPFLDIGYHTFAAIRPFLPRKNKDCQESPYCQIPRKP